MTIKRIELLAAFAHQAEEYDRRGDVVLRTQAANSWREVATSSEAAKAPESLTWTGRAAKRSRIYVIAQDGQESVRVALNPEAAIEINDRRWDTGISMDRAWIGRDRIITQSYSIWDNGQDRGQCVGTRYTVISDPNLILNFCQRAGIEPPSWIQAQEA